MSIATSTHYAPEKIDIDSLIESLRTGNNDRELLYQALLCRDEEQAQLFALAREKRSSAFPKEEVEVRSVIELSNVCQQSCNYCSMAKESDLKRYVIRQDALKELVLHLYERGRRVMLLQSGENSSDKFVEYAAKCVQGIKELDSSIETILCLGNLSPAQYRLLKGVGADRYILKFESSNPALYSEWKPSDTLPERLACLQDLVDAGFKVGSGSMVGLPGQNLDDIVEDILTIGKYNLSMMSCTVFIPGEKCNYHDQPMGDLETALNTMALMRILNPHCLMPTTSCLEKAGRDGQFRGLMAGANTVTIHDGTPEKFRELFPIYSTDRCTPDISHMEHAVMKANLKMGAAPLI
jgi:biotin synthase